MHEYALAEDVLRAIQSKAEEKGLQKVSYAKVLIGEMLIHDPKEFHEIFSSLVKGIGVEGVRLDAQIVKLKGVCANCKKEFNPDTLRLDCPHCGSTNIQMTSGNELIVKELR